MCKITLWRSRRSERLTSDEHAPCRPSTERYSNIKLCRFSPTRSQSSKYCALLALPVEIRLLIYEHLYCVPQDSAVDLAIVGTLDEKAPTKDLLYTCKTIYYEAKTAYHHAHRSYWVDSAFYVKLNYLDSKHEYGFHTLSGRKPVDVIPAVREDDSNHIRQLKFETTGLPETMSIRKQVHLLHPFGGGWEYWCPFPPSFIRLVDLRPFAATWMVYRSESSLMEACEQTPCRVPLKQQILIFLKGPLGNQRSDEIPWKIMHVT